MKSFQVLFMFLQMSVSGLGLPHDSISSDSQELSTTKHVAKQPEHHAGGLIRREHDRPKVPVPDQLDNSRKWLQMKVDSWVPPALGGVGAVAFGICTVGLSCYPVCVYALEAFALTVGAAGVAWFHGTVVGKVHTHRKSIEMNLQKSDRSWARTKWVGDGVRQYDKDEKHWRKAMAEMKKEAKMAKKKQKEARKKEKQAKKHGHKMGAQARGETNLRHSMNSIAEFLAEVRSNMLPDAADDGVPVRMASDECAQADDNATSCYSMWFSTYVAAACRIYHIQAVPPGFDPSVANAPVLWPSSTPVPPPRSNGSRAGAETTSGGFLWNEHMNPAVLDFLSAYDDADDVASTVQQQLSRMYEEDGTVKRQGCYAMFDIPDQDDPDSRRLGYIYTHLPDPDGSALRSSCFNEVESCASAANP